MGRLFDRGDAEIFAGLQLGGASYVRDRRLDGELQSEASRAVAIGPTLTARFGGQNEIGTVLVNARHTSLIDHGSRWNASADVKVHRRLTIGVALNKAELGGPGPVVDDYRSTVRLSIVDLSLKKKKPAPKTP